MSQAILDKNVGKNFNFFADVRGGGGGWGPDACGQGGGGGKYFPFLLGSFKWMVP